MNSDETIYNEIRTYLDDELGLDIAENGDDHMIFENGVDSIEVIKLVLFLEQQFSIRIDSTVTTLDSFANVNAIAQTVITAKSK